MTNKSLEKIIAKNMAIILIAELAVIYATNAQLMKVIQNTGEIATTEVWAESGSADDIQAAVDAVAAAGGGTVYIPAGNFTFNITASGKIDPAGRPCGVLIPGGVNVIGAGSNQTILFTPVNCWNSTADDIYVKNVMFSVDGSNGKRVRISGIYFQGSVNPNAPNSDDYPGLYGVSVYGGKDVRIDHCVFIDFCAAAIYVTNNWVYTSWNRGVIDHCIIDNPYKDWFLNVTGRKPYWAYGIIVVSSNTPWTSDWAKFFGKYEDAPTAWYIEDCTIKRTRHCVASTAHAFYVIRHCVLEDMVVAGYGSYIDAHGTSHGFEAYDNVIINMPVDYRSTTDSSYWGQYQGIGINPRGGFGLIFNNTIKYIETGSGIKLSNDQSDPTYRLNGFWIWNNTYEDVTTQLTVDPGDFTIEENKEYFLRAPSLDLDGFQYTPYPYPHPLTIKATP